MKIKTKLTLGVGLLFILIVSLSVLPSFYIYKFKADTENILDANYNSLEYSKNMMLALDRVGKDSIAAGDFRKNLILESKNITEAGEQETCTSLKNHFEEFLKNKNTEIERQIRNDLAEVMRLNMDAIQRKSDIAKATADSAVFWILTLGTICILIAVTLLFNLPNSIAEPITALTLSIKQIADRNYHERVNFESSSEFGDLARSFNVMAEKLEEYENSNLSKQLMNKKRVETLIENMRDPVIGLDENSRINFINEEALKILGIHKTDIMGKFATDVALNNDLLRELIRNENAELPQATMKIFADGKESYFEQEMIPISIIPTGEKEQKNAGKVIVLRNVTPFKELDFAKTNFIATISHELKTPIAAIKMGTQLLKNEKFGILNPDQKDLVRSIEEDGQRLLGITGELLNMAQVESGSIQLHIQDCKVSDLVNSALANNSKIAENQEITLVSEIKTDDSKTVHVDFDKTVWVLNNFITNAIKYSYPGEKVVVSSENNGEKIRFRVKDSGNGIDEKFHRQIFERYFQIPDESQSGTGLGLAISKNFIEKMGGKIGVLSEKGKGSEFWFEI